MNLAGKKIVVTGGDSMIGRALVTELKKYTCEVTGTSHKYLDLMDYKSTYRYFHNIRPDYVFHLAGYNGNIRFNGKYPHDIFYKTTQMGLNVLNICKELQVKKVCSLISSCAYSPDVLMEESRFFEGKPHDTVEAHGFAKKILVEYGRQINKQYPDTRCTNVVVNHVYGPHDNFNPEKTKVVGSLIAKFEDAKKNNLAEVELWGSGNARREFIYVDDVAKYLPAILTEINDELINLGCNSDISIKELAETIQELVGYKGKIFWNGSSEGQMRKLLSSHRINKFLQLEFTSLKDGLKKTIEWYEAHHK